MDYPRTWPPKQLPSVRVIAQSFYRLQVDNDAEWEVFIPGEGLIHLGEQKKPFMISMMHELRCLDLIRREILRSAGLREEVEVSREVIRHCVNYLRQTTLCRADTSLEMLIGDPPNAYPLTQVCKDWETVYEEIAKNQTP